MQLWQSILLNAIKTGSRKEIKRTEFEQLFEMECYKLLEKIKKIIEDAELEDKECFERIERLVCLFEAIGTDCKERHDFG